MRKRDEKRYEQTQKIIVPRGTINPTSDTIIEIPKRLQTQQIVIAQKAGNVSVPLIKEASMCPQQCEGARPRENVASPNFQANRSVDQPVIIYVQKRIQTADPQQQYEKREYIEPLDDLIRKVMVDRANSSHSSPIINLPDEYVSSNVQIQPHYDKLLVSELPSSLRGKTRYVLLQEPSTRSLRPSRKKSCTKKCDPGDSDSEEEICPWFTSNRKANCDACCGTKAMRDKYNLQRAMENIPPKPSKISVSVSIGDLSDTLCSPCLEARSKTFLPGRSGSVLTDSDFEKIKTQLREARKRLDEAVALVGRTMSSRDTSSANYHDPKHCPLRNMVNEMRTEDIRSQPPCTLEERIRKNAEDLQKALRRLSTDVNKSTIPCTPIYPCEIPSVLSRQDLFRPPYESTKSLPTSAMKLGEYRQRSQSYDDREYVRFKEQAFKKNEGSRKCTAVQTKPSDIEDVLCTNVCSNTNTPPCTSDEILNKWIKLQPNPVRPIEKPSLVTIPCKPMFPCEIPSAILNEHITKSVKSAPAFDTILKQDSGSEKKAGGTDSQSKTGEGKKFVFKVSTQSQTVKTITLNKPNFDDEDSALEYIINALRSTSDPEDETPKTSSVTFKDAKK